MRHIEDLLERLATLTRLHTLDELEQNLLQVAEDWFHPRELFLLTIDRRGEAHSLRNGNAQVSDAPEAPADSTLRAAAHQLHEAHQNKRLCWEIIGNGTVMASYPLIDSPPLRTGLVMLLEQRTNEEAPITQPEHRVLDVFRNFCEILDSAQRDELTGLLNRKTFNDNMRRVVARICTHIPLRDSADQRIPISEKQTSETSQQSQHSVAIVDIDHFKSINDQFGHLVGDEVILAIANQLRECIRETDLIYRFGGEEFVIILSSISKNEAQIALERLRKTLSATELPRAGKVTLSYGLVTVEPNIQAHHLLDRADSALYYAKSQGRNQGHFYEDLVMAGAIQEIVDPTGAVELF